MSQLTGLHGVLFQIRHHSLHKPAVWRTEAGQSIPVTHLGPRFASGPGHVSTNQPIPTTFCIAHHKLCLQETDAALGDLLSKLKLAFADLEPVQAAVVRDAHRWGIIATATEGTAP